MTEVNESGCYYVRNFPIGEGQTDYEKYLRVPELLSLQKPLGECASPEETHFQVTHQAAELWMKLMGQEIERALAFLAEDKVLLASRSLRMVTDIQKLLLLQLEILGQNLSIKEYRDIRLALGQGSGMESPGFNRLLGYFPQVWDAYQQLLARRGVSIKEIYLDYHTHIELHTLSENLMDMDHYFHLWRSNHMAMVSRTIGMDSNSLKGIAVQVLQKGSKHRFFTDLLDVRNEITNESSVAYGGQPLTE